MFGGAFGGLDEMAPTSTDQTTEQEDSSVEENTDSEHEENLEQNKDVDLDNSFQIVFYCRTNCDSPHHVNLYMDMDFS